MKMNLINGKLMETKLKYGWTTEDFTEYLDCTEEEFIATLKKVFSSKAAKGMLNRLDDNKRQKNKGRGSSFGTKSSRNKKDKRTSNSEEIAILIEATLEKLDHVEKEEKNVEMVTEEESVEMTSETIKQEEDEIVKPLITIEEILAELSIKEKQIRHEICNSEAAKVHLIQERRSVNVQLLKHKDEMIKLRTQIEKIQGEVDELIVKGNNITQNIVSVNEELEYKHSLLESLQREIADLNKVTILAYENGEIECDGPVEFYVTEDWKTVFQDITIEEDVEELTIKEIKQLAKIIAFTKTLEKPFEVIFDNQVLQEIFNKVA